MSNKQILTQRVQENEETEKYVPKKEQNKLPETNLNEMETYDLPARVKVTIIKMMLNEVRKTMHEQSENFNEELEN